MTLARAFILGLVMVFGHAQTAAASDSPTEMVEETSREMLNALQSNRASLQKDPAKLHDLVNDIATPHFDVDFVVRYVLGRYWRRASPQQRAEFSQAFTSFIVNSYGKALLRYTHERVRVLPLRPGAEESRIVTVRSLVEPKNAQPIAIDYRLHRKSGEWLVCDVVVEGVSLMISYRNTFASTIEQKGLDALIDELKQRNEEFLRSTDLRE